MGIVGLMLDGVVCKERGHSLWEGTGHPRRYTASEDLRNQNGGAGEEDSGEVTWFR